MAACPKHDWLSGVCMSCWLIEWLNDYWNIWWPKHSACCSSAYCSKVVSAIIHVFLLGFETSCCSPVEKKNWFFSTHYTWPAECLDSWRTRWSDSLSNTVCHADTEDKKSGAASILSALSAANRLQHVGHACGSKKDKSMFRGQVCKKLIKVRFRFLSVWVVRSRAVIPPHVPFVGQSHQL